MVGRSPIPLFHQRSTEMDGQTGGPSTSWMDLRWTKVDGGQSGPCTVHPLDGFGRWIKKYWQADWGEQQDRRKSFRGAWSDLSGCLEHIVAFHITYLWIKVFDGNMIAFRPDCKMQFGQMQCTFDTKLNLENNWRNTKATPWSFQFQFIERKTKNFIKKKRTKIKIF